MEHEEQGESGSSDGAMPGPWRWHERALQWLDFPLGRFLDYGCGGCILLERVRDRCTECRGVDVDEDKILTARRRFPDLKLDVIGLDAKTTYPDDHFDTVALVEVIEHVVDERRTLAEIARILKPGGKLLLTTPHAGLLTFLDVGNFKFIFPGLHRFIHLKVLRDKAYYASRFTRAVDKGLVGDISISHHREPWHRHYKSKHIVALCPPSLVLQKHGVYFPGMRAFMLLQAVLRVCTRRLLGQLPPPLSTLEQRLSRVESRTGDQLVMLFRKQDTG